MSAAIRAGFAAALLAGAVAAPVGTAAALPSETRTVAGAPARATTTKASRVVAKREDQPCLFARSGLDVGDRGFATVSSCLRLPKRVVFATSPEYEGCLSSVKLVRITWTRWTATGAVGRATDNGVTAWCTLSTSENRVVSTRPRAKVTLSEPQSSCGVSYFARITVTGRNRYGQSVNVTNSSPWTPSGWLPAARRARVC